MAKESPKEKPTPKPQFLLQSDPVRENQECTHTKCIKCPKSPSVCDKCANGYYLDQDRSNCKECRDGCIQCTSAKKCTACSSMKYLTSQGHCVFKKEVLYGFVIGIVVLIFFGVGLCWFCDSRMRRKEGRLRMAQQRKLLKKKLLAQKYKQEHSLEDDSDLMSSDTSLQSDAYLSANQDSENQDAYSNSFGKKSRVKMKGGMLTEYINRIKYSRKQSLNDMSPQNSTPFQKRVQSAKLQGESEVLGSIGDIDSRSGIDSPTKQG